MYVCMRVCDACVHACVHMYVCSMRACVLCYNVRFGCSYLTSCYGRNHTTSVGSQNWSGESSRHLEWHSQNRSGESSRHLDWRSPNRSGESNRHLDWRGNCGTTGTGRVAEKRLAAAVVPKEHPTEYIEKKTKSLVDEYLQIHDLNVRISCCGARAICHCMLLSGAYEPTIAYWSLCVLSKGFCSIIDTVNYCIFTIFYYEIYITSFICM